MLPVARGAKGHPPIPPTEAPEDHPHQEVGYGDQGGQEPRCHPQGIERPEGDRGGPLLGQRLGQDLPQDKHERGEDDRGPQGGPTLRPRQ